MLSGRFLVTGATGMIGANLVRRLAEDAPAARIFVTHRPESDLSRLADLENHLEMVPMDLNHRDQIDLAVRQAQPDVVFHLASTIWSQVSEQDSDRHYRTNVLGTQFLLEALRRTASQARFVFSGSSAAYGSGCDLSEDQLPAPNTIYGASKAAVSTLLQTYGRLYGLHAVELRLFTPFGPWEDENRLIPAVVRSIREGRSLQMTAGIQERDFVFVGDVVDALLRAVPIAAPACEIINIAGGKGITVRTAAETVVRISGQEGHLAFGARPQRADEMLQMSADISKARSTLGWQPTTSFEEGIRRTWEWWSRNSPTAEVS